MSVKLVLFFYPSILTCVLGAKNNRLIETVILSTHNICFGGESKDYILITHTYLMAWIAVCFCSKWETWLFWNCPAYSGHSHIFRQSENSYFAQYISRIIHMQSGNRNKQNTTPLSMYEMLSCDKVIRYIRNLYKEILLMVQLGGSSC